MKITDSFGDITSLGNTDSEDSDGVAANTGLAEFNAPSGILGGQSEEGPSGCLSSITLNLDDQDQFSSIVLYSLDPTELYVPDCSTSAVSPVSLDNFKIPKTGSKEETVFTDSTAYIEPPIEACSQSFSIERVTPTLQLTTWYRIDSTTG